MTITQTTLFQQLINNINMVTNNNMYKGGGVINIEFWYFDPKVGEMVHKPIRKLFFIL